MYESLLLEELLRAAVDLDLLVLQADGNRRLQLANPHATHASPINSWCATPLMGISWRPGGLS